MGIQLVRTFTFNAAHRVPDWPGDEGRRVHGHTYRIDLVLEGDIDDRTGWLIDFGDIREAFAPIADELDHAELNAIAGLESGRREAVERWVFERLRPRLPMLVRVSVSVPPEMGFEPARVPSDPALGLPGRVAFTVHAAHHLPHCGEAHRCRRLHGHSYRIEVGAGNLENLETALQRIHERLDHRCLNEIEGLENPTAEILAIWIWNVLESEGFDLRVVVVRESPECACIYRGKTGTVDLFPSDMIGSTSEDGTK